LQKEQEWDKKGCKICVKDGKLQLLCKDDDVLAEAEICGADGDTIERDPATGAICVKGLKERNSGNTFSMWIGTQAEYDAITRKNPNTFYWITDDPVLDEINAEFAALDKKIEANKTELDKKISTNASGIAENKEAIEGNKTAIAGNKSDIDKIKNGETVVPKALNATNAGHANSASVANSLSVNPFRSPNRKTDKKMTYSIGKYYYIYAMTYFAGSPVYLNCGLLWWEGGETELGTFGYQTTGLLYRVMIDSSMNFRVWKYQTQADGAITSTTEITNNSDTHIYIAQIG